MADCIVDNWFELEDKDEIALQIPIEKEVEIFKREFSELEPGHGLTLLMFAAKTGKENIIVALIKSGESINEKCSKGLTALSHAILSGHFKCVQMLVANCADVSCADKNGDTPLMLAAKLGFIDIVKCLLAADARASKKSHAALCSVAFSGDMNCLKSLLKAGINLNFADPKGLTVLMKAATEGLTEVVECLLQAEAKVNLQCKEGKTALSYAARNGHLECVQALHTFKAHLNLADSDGQTPLMKAAMNGHINVVDYLTKFLDEEDFATVCTKGKTAFCYAADLMHFDCVKIFAERCKVNIDVKDHEHQTPLIKALLNNHSELVEYLLWHGARCDTIGKDGMGVVHCAAMIGNMDPFQNVLLHDKRKITHVIDLKNAHGQTPLMIAAINRHGNIVTQLLKLKADANLRCNKSWTALHYAAQSGKFSCIKNITKAAVDVNVETQDGQTSLMMVCMKGMPSVASHLISLKADVNKQCLEGRGALHYAVLRNNSKCVEELLKAEAHINIKDKHGDTPLILAARCGRNQMVELLIKHGANVNFQNNEGKTALHCAKSEGTLKCYNLLIKANANVQLKDKDNKTAAMTKRIGFVRQLPNVLDGVVNAELACKLEKAPMLKEFKDFTVS